ncbi:hypothetical protein, partial [uncultured Lamprocystis sp.]|uniref:hypothetical protein n=1 Tax=uncultured Lamprocystis sp. TaxID=543132 RepID=UPI0025D14F6B
MSVGRLRFLNAYPDADGPGSWIFGAEVAKQELRDQRNKVRGSIIEAPFNNRPRLNAIFLA